MNTNRSRDLLQLLAVMPVALAHLADFFFFPQRLAGAPFAFILFDLIGHMTMPILCLMLAQGYQNAQNRTRFFVWVLLAAAAAQIPFIWFYGQSWLGGFNMFFGAAVGLLALLCLDSIGNRALKAAAIVLLAALTVFCEWPFTAVLWMLLFHAFRHSSRKQAMLAAIIFIGQMVTVSWLWSLRMGDSWKNAGLFVVGQTLVIGAALLIGLYGCIGRHGKHPGYVKWFFCLYYPVHFLMTGMVATVLQLA